MNATTKVDIVNPNSEKWVHEFTQEFAKRRTVERKKTNRAGEYGFRVIFLFDETQNKRLIDAATRFADDDALGVQGVRGERVGIGGGDFGSSAGGYTQTRLDALKRLRNAKDAIGIVNYEIMRHITVNCFTARELGRYWGVKGETAKAWALKANEALADHYEGIGQKSDLRQTGR